MKIKTNLLNSILNILIIIIVLGTFIISVYKYKINKNYLIFGQIKCQEESKKGCFVMDCGEQNDPRCTDISEDDKMYYRLIERTAKNNNLDCKENSTNCRIINCTDETISIYDPEATCAE